MAKLTKSELKKKIVNISEEIKDYSTLSELIEKYGPDAKVYSQSYGYDDSDIMISVTREETDEEYKIRLESLLKIKQKIEKSNKKEKQKQKQKDKEYQTYLKLKEKFEGKE